jgi:TatA/E family protein of Tat protein translocase
MPFGLQPIHLVIIAIVALLIFGPQKLPEISRGIGRAINEFKKGTQDITSQIQQGLNENAVAANDTAATTAQPVSINAQSNTFTANPQSEHPEPAVGKFCNDCGAKNPTNAKFCNSCGAAFPIEQS